MTRLLPKKWRCKLGKHQGEPFGYLSFCCVICGVIWHR